MYIDRQDIETIVQTIIDERLQSIIESLKAAAYYERDHGGDLERAIARGIDAVSEAIDSSIEEAQQ